MFRVFIVAVESLAEVEVEGFNCVETSSKHRYLKC